MIEIVLKGGRSEELRCLVRHMRILKVLASKRYPSFLFMSHTYLLGCHRAGANPSFDIDIGSKGGTTFTFGRKKNNKKLNTL